MFDAGWGCEIDEDELGCLPYLGALGPDQRRLSDVPVEFQDSTAAAHILSKMGQASQIGLMLYRRLKQAEHLHPSVRDEACSNLGNLICDIKMMQAANRLVPLLVDIAFDCLCQVFSDLTSFACSVDLLEPVELAELRVLNRECGRPLAASSRSA